MITKKGLLCFFGVFFICGISCSQNFQSPSTVAKLYYKSMAENDVSQWMDCITNDDAEWINDQFGKEGANMFLTMFFGASIGIIPDSGNFFKKVKILSESIDGDIATVTIDWPSNLTSFYTPDPLILVKTIGQWKVYLGLDDSF